MTAVVEFSKRPSTSTTSLSNPHHIVSALPEDFDLPKALAISDVVISAVPSQEYKIPTANLKDGCICVNVAGEKNFEKTVRERVRPAVQATLMGPAEDEAGLDICSECWRHDHRNAATEPVSVNVGGDSCSSIKDYGCAHIRMRRRNSGQLRCVT